jgi:hypothetical protein
MRVLDENGQAGAAIRGTAPNHEQEITYTFATEKGKTYTFVKGNL